MVGIVALRNGTLGAAVSARGAELQRLHTVAGEELLWDGNPDVWSGRSPLLFPVVGSVKDDRITVRGRRYPLQRHGFARTSTFELVEASTVHCTWRLRSSDETRARYPFAFRLDVTYALDGARLAMRATVANDGAEPMPASFGFHPAFRWPLVPGVAREDHDVRFEKAEPEPIRRLAGGLLGGPEPTPVSGARLALADALFERDALIFDRLHSRRLTYGPGSGRRLQLDFPAMPHVGIWSKPGAGFVCLEPWHGFASPVDFDGELAEKPGIVTIPTQSEQVFELAVTVL
ncbi:MAG: aldose 1-epimerase family protein [Proteobacteria bacterium]|nr:aldose 1-epimerase family protein [Pseudomonadota bacterium]